MARRAEDFDVGVVLRACDAVLNCVSVGVGHVDRNKLPGDSLFIFHARVADVGARHAESFGDTTDRVRRGEVDLFDKKVNVFTFAARFVERLFLDEEIGRPLLDLSTDAGRVGREIRKVGGGRFAWGKVGHERSLRD